MTWNGCYQHNADAWKSCRTVCTTSEDRPMPEWQRGPKPQSQGAMRSAGRGTVQGVASPCNAVRLWTAPLGPPPSVAHTIPAAQPHTHSMQEKGKALHTPRSIRGWAPGRTL